MKNKMQEIFYGHLERLAKGKLPYAIWGAGWTGKSVKNLIRDFSEDNLKEQFVVDNNSALWGENGVISPDDFFNQKDTIDTVFVCVYVADEVEKQLKENGYEGNIVPVSSSILNSGYYVTWFENCKKEISGVKEILFDERSTATLDTFYNVAKSGDTGLWDAVNGKSEDKLLDPDILKFTNAESMVEIGAFIGDTTDRFLSISGGRYKSILGIEPDPENFSVLRSKFAGVERAIALPYAVGEKKGTVKFLSNMSESGYITPDGDIEVEMIRLDDIDEAQDATFIKVSTNGLDLSALKGAKEIIKTNRPKLSYYCGGGQLWEIPQYLRTLVPEYKFYVRHYGIGMQAMIGYAVI